MNFHELSWFMNFHGIVHDALNTIKLAVFFVYGWNHETKIHELSWPLLCRPPVQRAP